MRILLLCYEYPPVGGGGGVGAQQYAEAWVAQGHDVTVLTSRSAGLPAQQSVAGVDVRRVATFGLMARATSSMAAMACYNVTGFVYVLLHRRRLKRFDVINTHFSIPTGLLGYACSIILGLPNVLTIIGGDIYDPSKKSSPHRVALLRFLNNRILSAADRLIAISTDTKNRAELHYQVRRPIRVINYGFRPTEASVENGSVHTFDPKRYYLIAIGRLVDRKGFDTLISAMAKLPGDVELLLVGDGPLEVSLRQLAIDNDVSSRVHLLGFQARSEIHRLLRQCNCFVLSSLHEGLGIVVQEAMDAGLPVVATDNGGQVDLIKHGRNGLLVPTRDSKALADAIRTLHCDPELGERMGRNNLADIKRLSLDDNCRLYLDVFEEVLPGSKCNDKSTAGLKEDEAQYINAGK